MENQGGSRTLYFLVLMAGEVLSEIYFDALTCKDILIIKTRRNEENKKMMSVEEGVRKVENDSSRKIEVLRFLKKYFWEGQKLSKAYSKKMEDTKLEELPWSKRVLITQRRLIGALIPAAVFHLFWWSYFIKFNQFYLFKEKYPISIMMVFGSLVAGMTSEGGGSIAFPVMTLVFGIAPSIARDFTLLIQSCGMTAASFTLLWMRIKLEWNSIVFCTIGSTFGAILCLETIDEHISPPYKKMIYVSFFFAFALALCMLNRVHDRKTYPSVQNMCWWKALVLLCTGFLGGIFTGMGGSGVDITSFSMLTLLFRVSEKVATPTSILLMAINTVVTSIWRIFMVGTVQPIVYQYVGVAMPIVVFGAPLGSVIGTHFHRLVLFWLVFILELVSLIGGFAVVVPSAPLVGVSVAIVGGGGAFYGVMTWIGGKLMDAQKEADDVLENKDLHELN